jgi:hypothetical protein
MGGGPGGVASMTELWYIAALIVFLLERARSP